MNRIYKVAVIGTSYVAIEEAETPFLACLKAGWAEKACEVVDITDAVKKIGDDRGSPNGMRQIKEIFRDGEIIPLYEFESRFKKSFCDGNWTAFAQWPVRVEYEADGGLMIKLTAPIDLTEVEG